MDQVLNSACRTLHYAHTASLTLFMIDASKICGKYARIAGLACHFVDQDTFRTFRVARLQREGAHVRDSLSGKQFVEIVDGVLLIIFDPDIALIELKIFS